MPTKTRILERHFERIARIYGKNLGVKVQLVGTGRPCTNGEVIYIPANSDYFNQEDRQIMDGLIDHEAGHVLSVQVAKERGSRSPFKVLADVGKSEPQHLGFFKTFEDIRAEQLAEDDHPGIAQNLHYLAEKTMAANAKKMKEREQSPNSPPPGSWQLVETGLYCKARGVGLQDLPMAVQKLIDGPLADLVEESLELESADASLELARKAYKRLEDLAGSQKQEPSPFQGGGEGGSGGGGQGSSSDSPGEQEQDDGSGEKAQAAADEAGTDFDDETVGENQDDENGAGEVDSDSETSLADLARALISKSLNGTLDQFEEVVRRLNEAAKADAKGRHIPHPKAIELDTHEFVVEENIQGFERLRDETSSVASTLRSRILQVLKSRMRTVWHGDQHSGVLDSRTLYSVRMGNKQVFAQKKMGQKVDCSILILVDESASMRSGDYSVRNSKIYCAQQAVVALGECLSKLRGIEFSVLGFDTDEENTIWGRMTFSGRLPIALWSRRISPRAEEQPYNRFCAMRYRTYKTWSEGWSKARYRIPTMEGRCVNIDGEAVWRAGEDVATRVSERKILIVLSDGAPNSTWSNSRQNDYLKEVVDRLIKAGIEVVGVGINSTHVKDYYPDAIVVHEIGELPSQLMRLLERYLVQGSVRPLQEREQS